MNLYHLRYFCLLAQVENYTQTAKLLNITQPSLSSAIHSLENEIGIKLFIKKGRTAKITAAGQLFAQNIQQALTMIDNSVGELKEIEAPQEIISVGLLRSLSLNWFPKMMRQFLSQSTNQQINFKLSNGNGLSPNLIAELKAGIYDICFCSLVTEYTPEIEFFPIAAQEFVVITPLDHPLSKQKSINLLQTIPYSQITFAKRSGLYSIIHQLFQKIGFFPHSRYSMEEDQAIAGLVANGFGIAIVPNSEILKLMPLKIIPLNFPKEQRVFYMASLRSGYQKPATQKFIKFIKQNCRLN
ncbi:MULTISPECIES: LysR family transcriptional regulator [Liquorilactobacillus]|uniref:LysR family transcriptional regulator n=2 Tax=Liquorilactobacillus nagelii TaxID=82688 RepID=A0A3Q8CC29_9LACO|nr:LysR family transcriptional regulator [Liquorilactobacillus nagelii]AUJ32017.1 LysR family transcriptional regulator [Liquorilactobacillus nagelii]MCC7615163.1 LysR family transcriptional regulator [Liquorilactobacillus nagelii]MCP9314827.1 LysR family transcriptional regulator [Liquorilactobacillus nagelii]